MNVNTAESQAPTQRAKVLDFEAYASTGPGGYASTAIDYMTAVNRITSSLALSVDPEIALANVLREVCRILECPIGMAWLAGPDPTQFELASYWADIEQPQLMWFARWCQTHPLGRDVGPLSSALRDGQSLYLCQRSACVGAGSPLGTGMVTAGLRNLLLLPIAMAGEVNGVLAFFDEAGLETDDARHDTVRALLNLVLVIVRQNAEILRLRDAAQRLRVVSS